MEEKQSEKIRWGKEILKVLRIIGGALLKVFIVLINIIITLLLILAIMGIICGCAFAVYIDQNVDTEIDANLFRFTESLTGSSSELYYYEFTDRTNRVGEAIPLDDDQIYGSGKSVQVSYEDIPEDLINAFIAIEDKRFRTHDGVDWIRTTGAFLQFFSSSSSGYGGSTITQQLIKNVTGDDSYRIQRKIQEIFWALDLEKQMDKTEIITAYMNIVGLANGYTGVGAAAYGYFSKDVSELTLIECAAIAAITQNPSKYNPITNEKNNFNRRENILWEMLDQGLITKAEYDEASNKKLELNIPEEEKSEYGINSWYTDMVIEDVIDDLTELGYSYAAAELMVFSGGLKIYTLVDPKVQSTLEEIYLDDSNFPKIKSGIAPQSSAIVLDPYTGDVLGVAGARGEKKGNRVQSFATGAVRPVGSSIKPIAVYAPSFEYGVIQWNTVYDDVPVDFGPNNNKAWPVNTPNTYDGLISIDEALIHSKNTIAIRTLMDLGVDRSFDFLDNQLNFHSLIDNLTLESGVTLTDRGIAALALGQFNYGITIRELVGGYTMFPNKGISSEPISYLKVTDSQGNIILNNENKEGRQKVVISEENAFIMNKLLHNVAEGVKRRYPTFVSYGIDYAGKTGTTQNLYDYTFVGYTPYYICGVWYGHEYPKALPGADSGASAIAWGTIMARLHKDIYEESKNGGEPLRKFEEATNDIIAMEYCYDSGKLCTSACLADPRGSRSTLGYFVKGTEPTEYCDRHILVKYDSVNGGVAGFDCPPQNITYVSLVKYERWFPIKSVRVVDAQYLWYELPLQYAPYTAKAYPYYYSMGKTGHWPGLTNNGTHFNRYASAYFDLDAWREWASQQSTNVSHGQ